MALQYFLYNTNFGNTIVDKSVNPFAPSPPLAQVQLDFDIPEIQPTYLYAVNSGITAIIINSQANIDAYLVSAELPPTADGNVTYGQFTATTQQQNQAIEALTVVVTGFTATTGLQQITNVGAHTTVESTFNGGLRTHKIRPTGDTTTAIQINKANGTTHIINVDTVSGFTGFGTIAPLNKVHLYGTDIRDSSEFSVQTNGLTLDGVLGADKEIVWANNGVPKWQAQTYRGENDVFWYLVNTQGLSNPLTIMETGRVGINKQTNFLDYHTAEVVGNGLNDLIVSGFYTQNYDSVYEVEIVTPSGATDEWRWRVSIDGGTTYSLWSGNILVNYSPCELQFGVYLSFENLTGHTVGNVFRFTAFTQIPQATLTVAPMGIREVQRTNNYYANPIIYEDLTTKANGGLVDNMFTIFDAGTGATIQAFYWGTTVKINSIFFNLATFGTNLTLVAEYWNTDIQDWTVLDDVIHGYVDGTANLSKSGRIIWNPRDMSGWNKSFLPGLSGDTYNNYWVRILTTTPAGIAPVGRSLSNGNDKRLSVYSAFNDYRPEFYVDSLGRVNIGGGAITSCNQLQVNSAEGLSIASVAGSDSLVEFDSDDSCISTLKLKTASNNACGTTLDFSRTRGTLNVPLSMQTNDLIGNIVFRGRVGTSGSISSQITSQYVGDGSTTRCADLIFSTACGSCTAVATEKVRIRYNGNTGFGLSGATARIHIQSGTTTIAPLKFNSGSLLGSPQAGAVEFQTDAYYGTITSGTARRTFAFLESPTFTGAPELPVNTTLIGTSLCNLIMYSGGNNNTCLVKTCTFNAYTGASNSVISKGITGVTNGLTKYGCHDICLGGALSSALVLCGNQDICLQGKRVDIASSCGAQIYDKNGCGIQFYSSGGTTTIKGLTTGGAEAMRFQISDVQATFTDSRALPRGVEYNGDYSNTYNAHSLVDKAYVDSVASGLIVKASVWVATTGSITLSGLTTIDGVALANGNRVLVKNQSTGSLNGIYVATGTTWQRASDYNFEPSGEISNGNLIPITTGNTNANTIWVLTTPDPIVSGDTLTFTLFSKTSAVIAGNGICVTQAGGNYDVSTKLANNCGLCVDASGLYVNPAIAGTGLDYASGVINLDGSGLAGNSLSWTGTQFAVNTSGGTLSTALSNKLDKSIYQTYTGTTAPGQFASKSFLSTYTGTTAPAAFASKSFLSTYTGTTAPAAFASKSFVSGYTATTNSTLSNKAYLSGATFTGVVNVCKPAQNDNTTCAATTSWYISQGGSGNPLMDGIVACGISNLFSRQDHVHPRDTSRLATSGGTMTGTLNGTIMCASSCLCSPITIGTTCVCGPVVLGSTCVCSPITCGSTCVISPITIGSSCVCSPVILGSTYVCSPVITGSTKVCSPIVCGTSCISSSIACGSTCVIGGVNIGSTCSCSPIVLGSTCVCSPIGLFSTSSCSPIHCGACGYFATAVCSPIITGSTRVCSPTVIATTCLCSAGTAKIVGATTGSTLYLTTTPPLGSIVSGRTLFYNTTSKQVESIKLTGGSDSYFYTDSTTPATSAGAGLIMYLSGTPWTFKTGRYQVDFEAQYGNTTNNGTTCIIFAVDGATIGTCYLEGGQVANWVSSASLSRDITISSAGCHCLTIQFARGANTSCVTYGMIRAKRIC